MASPGWPFLRCSLAEATAFDLTGECAKSSTTVTSAPTGSQLTGVLLAVTCDAAEAAAGDAWHVAMQVDRSRLLNIPTTIIRLPTSQVLYELISEGSDARSLGIASNLRSPMPLTRHGPIPCRTRSSAHRILRECPSSCRPPRSRRSRAL